jgi:hypothetical protein
MAGLDDQAAAVIAQQWRAMIGSHEMRAQANGNEVHRFQGLLPKATAHRGASHSSAAVHLPGNGDSHAVKIAETDFRWRPLPAKTGDPVQLAGQSSAKCPDPKCQLLRTGLSQIEAPRK